MPLTQRDKYRLAKPQTSVRETNTIPSLFLSCEYVQRGRREGEEEDQGGGGRRPRLDGRVAEVRGAGADAGLAVGAVVGLRGEAAALVDRHAAHEVLDAGVFAVGARLLVSAVAGAAVVALQQSARTPCHAFAVALIFIVTGANSSLCVLVAVDLLSLSAACPGVLSVFVPAPNASISTVGAGVGCPSVVFALVRIETGFAFMTLQGHSILNI